MATQFFLSNDPSDVSGFKLAYMGTRGPNASTTISTAVTNLTAGVATRGMTLTAGGSAGKWITRPLSAAVTVVATIGLNIWQFQSAANGAGNSDVDIQLFQFTAGAQVGNAFFTSSINVNAQSTTSTRTVSTVVKPTSTAFAVGDRIVILPNVNSTGLVPGSGTLSMDFNGQTEDIAGDTFVQFDENIQTATAQGAQLAGSPSLGNLEDLRFGIASLQSFGGQMYSADAKIQAVLNEIAAQRDLRGA